MNTTKKLNLIVSKIQSIKGNKFVKMAKNEKIAFYIENVDKLENFPIEKIENHNFQAEILALSFKLEKLETFSKKAFKKIDKLERHLYASELNTIWFKNGKFIKVPQCDTIQKAINQIIANMTIEQIKAI